MCRDKALVDDDHIIESSVVKPRVGTLQEDGAISRDYVPLRKTVLALTAPFHQSCRSHVGTDYKIDTTLTLT